MPGANPAQKKGKKRSDQKIQIPKLIGTAAGL